MCTYAKFYGFWVLSSLVFRFPWNFLVTFLSAKLLKVSVYEKKVNLSSAIQETTTYLHAETCRYSYQLQATGIGVSVPRYRRWYQLILIYRYWDSQIHVEICIAILILATCIDTDLNVYEDAFSQMHMHSSIYMKSIFLKTRPRTKKVS